MKTLQLICLLALFANFGVAAPSLIGVWKSNKELSVNSMYMDPSIKEESKEKFRNLFGRLQITYTKDKVIEHMEAGEIIEEYESTSAYRIVSSTKNKITIKWEDLETGEEGTHILHFVTPDRYWIKLPSLKKFNGREYFDRIEADQVGAGQPHLRRRKSENHQ